MVFKMQIWEEIMWWLLNDAKKGKDAWVLWWMWWKWYWWHYHHQFNVSNNLNDMGVMCEVHVLRVVSENDYTYYFYEVVEGIEI